MTVSSVGLTGIGQSDLGHLLRLVSSAQFRAPLRAADLQAAGLGHLWHSVGWLADLSADGLQAVLRATLAERARPAPRLELVWTGPEARGGGARDTGVVVRELFARAERSVLVAGFVFWGGETIFEPLHRAMAERGVEASLFLHIDEARFHADTAQATAARAVGAFLADNWPPGGPRPRFFYDPRTADPAGRVSLHAKCVVVDDHWALVSSANFTDRAHTRNIEVGVLIEDAGFASLLARQWRGLVGSGLVVEVPREALHDQLP